MAARFPEYRELILAYDKRYMETIGGANQPVVEILRALKEQGYPRAEQLATQLFVLTRSFSLEFSNPVLT